MTQIGQFTATHEGFAGRIRTLTLDIELTLVVTEPSETEGAPAYRVLAGSGDEAVEVGAGWKRVGEKAGSYVALVIDDPAFVAPLRANLFQADPRTHTLLWNRQTRRERTA